MDAGFVVYFDIARDFQWNWQDVVLGVAIAAFALLSVVGAEPGPRAIGVVIAAISLIGVGFALLRTYDAKFVWPSRVRTGDVTVVQGVIERIRLSERGWGLGAAFKVDEITFSHTGNSHWENYNLARDPRRVEVEGKCVRIKMTPNHEILWFGVAPPESCAQSPTAKPA